MRVRVIQQRQWNVYAACEEDGQCELLSSLQDMGDPKLLKQVLALLRTVAELGPQALPADICHQIRGDIWQFSKRNVRVLWFFHGQRVVVCCHSFAKKRQKTPTRELERAERVREEFRGRELVIMGESHE